ncbi:MAG: DNA cytosine methyltransferase [Acidobacteriota bacterium]
MGVACKAPEGQARAQGRYSHRWQARSLGRESQDHQIPRADVVVGGPPCQGFSLLNKQRRQDARRQLWRPFLEVVRRAGASVFVMENRPSCSAVSNIEKSSKKRKSLVFEWRPRPCVPISACLRPGFGHLSSAPE